MFFRKMFFFIGIRLNRGKIVDSTFSVLSSVKCISIFHFHLFPSFYLIIIYLPWWKIAFSARLSSTLIFHLPPSSIAWKTFLIPSYSEVYFLFLVSFPFKKHFHSLACLFENALPFFRKSFVICHLGYSLLPVRPISCPLFPFSRLPE